MEPKDTNPTSESKPEQNQGETQTTTDQHGQSHPAPKPESEPGDAAETIGTGSGGTQQADE